MSAQPKHYLVVDDDSTNNLICDFIIRRYDSNATVALYLDPEEALRYINQKYTLLSDPLPTVLFLDINMPAMSGFEFLDELGKLVAEIQGQFTIYMLSSSIEDFNSEARKYPMVAGFLSKPLTASHLEKIWNTDNLPV